MSSNIGASSSCINKRPLESADLPLRTGPFKKSKLTEEPLQLLYPDLPYKIFKDIFFRLNVKDQANLIQVNRDLNNFYWSYIYPPIMRKFLSNPDKCKPAYADRWNFIQTLKVFERVNPKSYDSLTAETKKIKISIPNDRYRSLLLLENFKELQELDYSQQLDEDDYKFSSKYNPDIVQDKEFLLLKKKVKSAPEHLTEDLALSFPGQITKLTLQNNHLNNCDILSLASLKNLTYLDVSYNVLSRLGVSRIAQQFPKLKYLDIGFQLIQYDDLNIQGSDLPLLNSLQYLETLRIGGADIDGDSSMQAIGGISRTLKSIYMFNKIFNDFDYFKFFQIEHLEIEDIAMSDGLRNISILKDSLKSLALTQFDYEDGDISEIFTELKDFSKLEKIHLSVYDEYGKIKKADNFTHIINCPIKSIHLEDVYTSALRDLSSFKTLVEVRLDNCIVDEQENLKVLANKLNASADKANKGLHLHLYEPKVEDLKFVDTLKLKKLSFDGIKDEEKLAIESTLFSESASTLESLTFKLIKNISSYSKILKGLNLSKLKVQAEKKNYELAMKEVDRLTFRMTNLKDVNIWCNVYPIVFNGANGETRVWV